MENPLNNFASKLELYKYQEELTVTSNLMENWDESFIATLNINIHINGQNQTKWLGLVESNVESWIKEQLKDVSFKKESEDYQTRYTLISNWGVSLYWLSITESDDNIMLVLIGCPNY